MDSRAVGRVWMWDEGHGGAYFLDGGYLCWAEYDSTAGRFEWETAAQVDSRDLLSGDPGWDYAKMAEARLNDAAEALEVENA